MATAKAPGDVSIRVSDNSLVRAIEAVAAARQQPTGEMVNEALREWLERQEEQEDLAAIAEADDDPTDSWEEVKAALRARRAVAGA